MGIIDVTPTQIMGLWEQLMRWMHRVHIGIKA